MSEPNMTGAVPVRKKKSFLWIIPVVIVLVLAGACAGLGYHAATYTGIFPGVTAAEETVVLTGLSREQAQDLLEERLTPRFTATEYRVELDGQIIKTCSAADAGYSPYTDAMADQAFAVGRSGGILRDTVALVKGYLGMGKDIPLMIRRDEETLQALVDQITEENFLPALDGSYTLSRDGLFATNHRDGRTVDTGLLYSAFSALTLDEVNVIHCPVTVHSARALDVEAMARQLNAEPLPARYDATLGRAVDGQVGVSLDSEAALYVLQAAAPGETVQLPAAVTFPEMTAAQLEEVLFRDLLSSSTTTVTGSSARRGNVKLAGENVHGTILNDGDIFDYNLVVGERTAERGFGPAASYINGQTVDTIGGGICQVSSTVYQAALRANLEIVERYAHRFYPGYIDLGQDATVSWGGPEFRFKNNTGYPIRIDVTYQNNKLTVDIYGTRTDDTYVKITRELLGTTGYEVEYVETDELPYGTQKEQQNGYTGYHVKTYRNVYDSAGNLLSKTFESESNYKSRNQIILVGTAGRPQAAPPPAEEDSAPALDPQPPAAEEKMPEWLQPQG